MVEVQEFSYPLARQRCLATVLNRGAVTSANLEQRRRVLVWKEQRAKVPCRRPSEGAHTTRQQRAPMTLKRRHLYAWAQVPGAPNTDEYLCALKTDSDNANTILCPTLLLDLLFLMAHCVFCLHINRSLLVVFADDKQVERPIKRIDGRYERPCLLPLQLFECYACFRPLLEYQPSTTRHTNSVQLKPEIEGVVTVALVGAIDVVHELSTRIVCSGQQSTHLSDHDDVW
jgi:hypothetical protein